MATDETTIGFISAIVSAIVLAIREAAGAIVRAIKGNTKAQREKAQAEEEARREEAAREAAKATAERENALADRETARILKAIDDLGHKIMRVGDTSQDTRERVARLEEQHNALTENNKQLSGWMRSLTDDVRTIKRRSTGKHE